MKKQNLKKSIMLGLVASSVAILPVLAANNGWYHDSKGWTYQSENNNSSKWKLIEGKWYYFDNYGYMKTGWIKDNDEWYYLYNDGSMASNTIIDNYYVGSDGAWIQYINHSLESPYQYTSLFESRTSIKDLDTAISKAIIDHGKSAYYPGELNVEGHITFGSEESDGYIKVYTLSSFSSFAFQNNIFEIISGCGSIPTVITLSKNTDNGYYVVKYEEAEDGETYENIIKKMFPENLYNSALSKKSSGYDILNKQKESQAQKYLDKIGRDSEISLNYVDKTYVTINHTAVDSLFIYSGKSDEFLNLVPDWIGTTEKIKNNERIIYETSQNKSADGYDIIDFKELKTDGTILQHREYKIIGEKAVLC